MPKNLLEKIKRKNNSLDIEKVLELLSAKQEDFFCLKSLRLASLLSENGADEITIMASLLFYLSENEIESLSIPQDKLQEALFIIKKAQQLKNLFSLKQKLKPTPIKKWRREFLNQQSENLRKMFFALTGDIRPILLSLVEGLDGVRFSVKNYSREEQQKIAAIAIEILAPLAYGIGLAELKGQLEDAAFPYLYIKEYNWLLKNTHQIFNQRKNLLATSAVLVEKHLNNEGIKILAIESRAKRYFSLYQKLLRHDMDIEKIYDLVALRIIVSSIEDCYKCLGAIHKSFKPLEGRIKDYIAAPKTNGYRALHTTVSAGKAGVIEIQIKTQAMQKEADFGAAAHLDYKTSHEKNNQTRPTFWLSQLRKWQQESQSPQQATENLKSGLFKNQIFVITPKGDIFNLPKGSTCVDFAYEVHSQIGERCEGCKINGKMANVSQALSTGDTIEIITNKNKTPSAKWLRFVKTKKARNKIASFLEKAYGDAPKVLSTPFSQATNQIASLKEKVEKIKGILPLSKKQPKILIAGETGFSVRFSKCCKPEPKDNIAAFISTGEPVSIHKTNCSNLKELNEKWPEKIVEAAWGKV